MHGSVAFVFNILHFFFSLRHLTLLASHSYLSLILSLPQSTNHRSLISPAPLRRSEGHRYDLTVDMTSLTFDPFF